MSKQRRIIFWLVGSVFIASGCSDNESLMPSNNNITKKNDVVNETVSTAIVAPVLPPLVEVAPVLAVPIIDAEPPLLPSLVGFPSKPHISSGHHPPSSNRVNNCGLTPAASDIDAEGFALGEDCDCEASINLAENDALFYVNPAIGHDDAVNNCSKPSRPCKTIGYAITKAASDGVLLLSAGTFNESGLIIDKNLTIIGKGALLTTINAQSINRAFFVNPGLSVTFCGITITNGLRTGSDERGGALLISDSANVIILNSILRNNASNIGGAISNEGNLSLINSRLIANQADFGGGLQNAQGFARISETTFVGNIAVFGGGLNNDESVVIMDESALSSNEADFGGGMENFYGQAIINKTTLNNNRAIFGGGIENANNTMTVVNSTISGNQAVFGGGINNNNGNFSISNSTVAQNSAETSGGGLQNFANATIYHTIFANNNPQNCDNEGSGIITSDGFNLDTGTTCGFSTSNNQINANADLLPLADYGGPTKTHALGDASAALNTGSASCGVITDQRNEPRPGNYPLEPLQGFCDIGAFEKQANP